MMGRTTGQGTIAPTVPAWSVLIGLAGLLGGIASGGVALAWRGAGQVAHMEGRMEAVAVKAQSDTDMLRASLLEARNSGARERALMGERFDAENRRQSSEITSLQAGYAAAAAALAATAERMSVLVERTNAVALGVEELKTMARQQQQQQRRAEAPGRVEMGAARRVARRDNSVLVRGEHGIPITFRPGSGNGF